MKIVCLLLAGICLFFVDCAKSRTPLEKAGITIVSATYGSGTTFADVSYKVISSLNQSYAGFSAHPHDLGEDPTPGWNKALVIVYEFERQRHVLTVGEGGKVNIATLQNDAIR